MATSTVPAIGAPFTRLETAAPAGPWRPGVLGHRAYTWARPKGTSWYVAAHTVIAELGLSDEALLARMAANTRREVRKASELYEVHPTRTGTTTSDAWMEEYGVIADAATAARGGTPNVGGWVEWRRPEMLLLVALQGGRVVAGSGFSVCPGGWLDYRANASRPDHRRSGVNALLAYRAMVVGRDLGCLAVNWGGANTFKRHLGGEVVRIYHEDHRSGAWLWCSVRRLRDRARRALRAARAA
jgi:hypothetical protein